MTDELRVAVVGAGSGGLAPADALVASGIEVVVLEARDRVGGRVWSRELGNGAVVEMGADGDVDGAVAVEVTDPSNRGAELIVVVEGGAELSHVEA